MSNSKFVVGDRYTVGKVLGSGMQGEVRAGLDNRNSNKVALKFVDKTNMSHKAFVALEREIDILKSVKSPHNVGLQEVFLDVVFDSKHCCVLVLDIASGGELFDFLMHSGYFDESLSRTYFKQLMSALHACHSVNVYHRDIKPENILLDSNFQLKLADFGLANYADEHTLLETECGTKSYMAPEIIARRSYEGEAVDMWSAGVVLFIMLCGSPPFEIAARTDWWFNAISMNRYDRFWAAHLRGAAHMRHLTAAQAFVEKLLRVDPGQRLKISQLESEDWYNGPILNDNQLYAEMSNRRRVVEEAKEAEKQAALRSKQQRATNGGRVDQFNVATNRSVGDILPPAYADFVANTEGRQANILYSYEESDYVIAKLESELRTIDAEAQLAKSEDHLSIEGLVRLPATKIELDDEVVEVPGQVASIVARLYQGSTFETDNLCIVDFERKSGELTSYYKLFNILREKFYPKSKDGDENVKEERFDDEFDLVE